MLAVAHVTDDAVIRLKVKVAGSRNVRAKVHGKFSGARETDAVVLRKKRQILQT